MITNYNVFLEERDLKRHITILVLMMLVISMIIPVFAADASIDKSLNNVINKEDNQTSIITLSKASKETLEIAKNIVNKLEQESVFSLYLGRSLEQLYDTAKWVAPETKDFETRKDASIALIEIYEEMLVEVREYDFDSYFKYFSKISEKNDGLTDFIVKGNYILGIRETIEAMLAIECYYNLLNEKQVQRMTEDFEEFSDYEYASLCKIYDDTEFGTLFEKYRANRSLTYYIGTTIYTTSVQPVTTLYASEELSTTEINKCRSDYENKPGYYDITYVSTATSFYNCHAYAWYNTSPGRKWVNNNFVYNGTTYYGVERFINDDHSTYLGSSDSVAQVNDIIVYYVDGSPAHSGIVISTNPLRIRSKWGQGCVWEHNKTSVPSGYKDTSGTVNVKYYRYTRSHNYQNNNYENSSNHKHQCSICGYYYLQAHSFEYTDYGSNVKHKCKCSSCGYDDYRPHNWVEYQVHPSKDENDSRYIPEYHCSDCGAMTLGPI